MRCRKGRFGQYDRMWLLLKPIQLRWFRHVKPLLYKRLSFSTQTNHRKFISKSSCKGKKICFSAKLHILNVWTLCGPIFYHIHRRQRRQYCDYCQAAIDTKLKWLLIKITYFYDNRICFYLGNLRCSTHQTALFDLRSSWVRAFCSSHGIPTFLHKNMAA